MNETIHDVLSVTAHRSRPMPPWKIGFYRQCRLWHGYLSAFAFIALMFFSATGILLNHPDWIRPADTRPVESRFRLPHSDMAAALKTGDPAIDLATLAQRRGNLHGVYASGDIDGDEAQLRYEGVSGNTSVTLALKTGEADASYRKSDALTIINDLHRGKNSGKAWKLLIDVSAGIFLILSLVGYILFFSLRHRLRQTMILTTVSLAALAAIFYWFVP